MKKARKTLYNYIRKLTPDQVEKLLERMPLLEELATMNKSELLFAEVFLGKVCGVKSA